MAFSASKKKAYHIKNDSYRKKDSVFAFYPRVIKIKYIFQKTRKNKINHKLDWILSVPFLIVSTSSWESYCYIFITLASCLLLM